MSTPTAPAVTRDDLLALATSGELPIDSAFVPQLNKVVWVQGMTGTQRDKWEASLVKGRGRKQRVDASNARASLAAQCIVRSPEDRTRLYTDADAVTLGRLPAAVLNPIYELCQKLSGVSDDDLEELEQRSAEAGSSDSASS